MNSALIEPGRRIKVGLVGAGEIVEYSHLPVLKNLEDVTVSWVYDTNFERSRLLASMYRVEPLPEGEVEKAIDRVDLCVLAIPYGSRLPYIEMCASKGKALYVEKPFAITLAEHERYCSLFPAHKLAVGYQRRYHGIVSTLASIIGSRMFGRLEAINYRYGTFHLKGGRGHLANATVAGGVTIESAVHSLDQILLFTGATAVKVTDVKSLHRGSIDYDTIFTSEITAPSMTISTTCEISTLRNLGTGLELHFESATVRCGLTHDAAITVTARNGDTTRYRLERTSADANAPTAIVEAFDIFWRHFLQSLTSGEESLTLGTSSLLTTHWIEQIYNHIRQD